MMNILSRAKTHVQPNGQVLINYSPERIREMVSHGDDHCSALASLLKYELEGNGIKIVKITTPEVKNRIADIIIEFNASGKNAVESIRNAIEELKSRNVGIGDAEIFLIQ